MFLALSLIYSKIDEVKRTSILDTALSLTPVLFIAYLTISSIAKYSKDDL